MRYRITTPVLGHTEIIGGCPFTKGVYEGEVDPGPLAHFRQLGYGVEELDDTPAEPVEAEPPAPVPTFADDPKIAPAGNASEADWRAHCRAIGATEDQVKDLKRDQLKELAAKIQEGPKA